MYKASIFICYFILLYSIYILFIYLFFLFIFSGRTNIFKAKVKWINVDRCFPPTTWIFKNCQFRNFSSLHRNQRRSSGTARKINVSHLLRFILIEYYSSRIFLARRASRGNTVGSKEPSFVGTFFVSSPNVSSAGKFKHKAQTVERVWGLWEMK